MHGAAVRWAGRDNGWSWSGRLCGMCHSHPAFPCQIFLVLLATSLCLAVASGFWAKMFQEKHSYLTALYKHTTPAKQAFFSFWSFTILLSVIIPMSMYIT